jgi:protein gp37
MQTTNISWCDYSWNPVTGCSRAGPECYNSKTDTMVCYAEKFSRRQGRTESAWTVENAAANVTMHPDRLEDPDAYSFPDGPGRVFVGSMTDMFHSEVAPGFVQRVLDRCREHPRHLWIFLTKRPQNAADWRLDWPANCIVGTSVGSGPGGEYPATTHRIEQLRDVDAAHRWVSFEPLIEEIGDVALDHIEWAVVGGESGSAEDRREMEHEWARDLLRQCREQDVAFYFKQSSGARPETGTRLTVENEEFGVYEQKRIREFPELPAVVRDARNAEVRA